PTGRPVAGCHSRTMLSPSALASSVPPGLNATASTPYWALVACRGPPAGWPVTGSHSRTVPSAPPMASVPPGLNATADTPPLGPEPIWSGAPAGPRGGGRVARPARGGGGRGGPEAGAGG